MDVTQLIPPADALPAAPWFFRVLLDATFVVHLLFMNIAFGLSMLGFVRSLRQSSGLSQQATLVPTFTALAVNLGIAPFLFLQVLYGQFLYVSSTLMGVYWLGLVGAVMAAYGLAYRQKYVLSHGPGGRDAGRGTLVWGLMSLLFGYASLVQTNNAVLLQQPELWAAFFQNASGTILAVGDKTFLPRWLHFVLASLAMGGLTLAMTGHKRTRHHDPHGPELTAEGLRWFSYATLCAAATGLWWLVRLPKPAMMTFMGGDAAATGLLLAGVALAGVTAAFGLRGRLMPAAGAAVATVAVMVPMRGLLRQAYLSPYFSTDSLPVRPEPSTVAMFLGCVALSLAVVIWAAAKPVHDGKGA